MTGPCISVILPVYNEEGNIAARDKIIETLADV